jgi:DNA mismatch repair protein MutL
VTPSRIRILNDLTINKIAAGEVIENPASVVKELVENSLDANAKCICVEIQEGGRQLIRISDDGWGMTQDEALLCLERHATSKIREVEDIQDLSTMGFRGEAVPSIASISKMTLLTCPRGDDETKNEKGTFIFVDGGRFVSCSSAARSPGTTIEVKSLFFNVPVRRKFQKSPTFDTQEILKLLGLLALAYPSIQFELIADQKPLLKTPLQTHFSSFNELLGKRLECVLGQEYASALLPLRFKQSSYDLDGFIGSATSHKPNRTGQHLFINQRLVFSPLISAAVREGYGTMLPNHRYPLFVLHLRMPGSLLDVNVHPQKKEIRLLQGNQLKDMIIQAIQSSLRSEQRHLDTFPSQEEIPIPSCWAPYPSFSNASAKLPLVAEEKWEFRSTTTDHPLTSTPQPFLPPTTKCEFSGTPLSSHSSNFSYSPTPLKHPSTLLLSTSLNGQLSAPSVLTTLLGYCILDPFNLNVKLFGNSANKREGGLALLDQRAAYSRIHYEHLLKRSSMSETQPLLIPMTLQLTPSEAQAMHEYLSLLNQMGFGLREFGEQAFMVDAFPHFLKQDQLQNFLNLLIQDLVEMQSSRRLQMQKEEQLALAACRASLPTAKRLSIDEAQGLIQQLVACELPGQCPLGKPTCIYLAPDEVTKWFKKEIP